MCNGEHRHIQQKLYFSCCIICHRCTKISSNGCTRTRKSLDRWMYISQVRQFSRHVENSKYGTGSCRQSRCMRTARNCFDTACIVFSGAGAHLVCWMRGNRGDFGAGHQVQHPSQLMPICTRYLYRVCNRTCVVCITVEHNSETAPYGPTLTRVSPRLHRQGDGSMGRFKNC